MDFCGLSAPVTGACGFMGPVGGTAFDRRGNACPCHGSEHQESRTIQVPNFGLHIFDIRVT
jgi:hypothetical protein